MQMFTFDVVFAGDDDSLLCTETLPCPSPPPSDDAHLAAQPGSRARPAPALRVLQHQPHVGLQAPASLQHTLAPPSTSQAAGLRLGGAYAQGLSA